MVSSTFIKLSSPLARSSLVALSVAMLIDATLTIYAAINYPYLTDHYVDGLYIAKSRTIVIVYIAISVAAIIISVSTAFACHKRATNYILLHAGITGVFVPVSILVYFTTIPYRYKVNEFVEDFYQMIIDYRISSYHGIDDHNSTNEHIHIDSEMSMELDQTNLPTKHSTRERLSSFINLIDSIQNKFACCGIETVSDWTKQWDSYIPPTCCNEPSEAKNIQWSKKFSVKEDHGFKHCTQDNYYTTGCLVMLKESEQSKYDWLSDLIIFMIVSNIANAIISLLLVGFIKTEEGIDMSNDVELSIVGVSNKPRPSQPAITCIRPRPSVAHINVPKPEALSARIQAVRFNMNDLPRTPPGGPPKFSKAARRGSSFL